MSHDGDDAGRARGGAVGYRPTATLSYATEMRRQLSRRRTQLTLGFMVVLPLIILIAFEFGGDTRTTAATTAASSPRWPTSRRAAASTSRCSRCSSPRRSC